MTTERSKYTYDLNEVTHSVTELRSQLPADSQLLYSIKANPHPAVVAHAAAAGVGLEVSSEGELAIAANARDTSSGDTEIVCTGPGKSSHYLRSAAALRTIISIESATELHRINQLGLTGLDILVRINATQAAARAGLQMTGTASQFGVDEPDAEHVIRTVIDSGHRFRGVHLYMGSNVLSEDDLVSQFTISTLIAERYSNYTDGPLMADLGGGFGHPFAVPGPKPRWESLRERVTDLTANLRAAGHVIAFESGRYISGSCGTLTATVLDVKVSKGERFAVVGSGVNHLGGLSGLRRLPQARFAGDSDTDSYDTEHLVGPLCTPVDILNKRSGTSLLLGDTITIPNVGAYGLSASLANFLSHPYPIEEITQGHRIVSTTQAVLTYQEVAAS